MNSHAASQRSDAEGICTPQRLQASHDAAAVEEACEGGRALERVPFDPAETVLSGAIVLLGTWRRRSRERVELLALTDRELRDIGLARCDALFESNKWFWRG